MRKGRRVAIIRALTKLYEAPRDEKALASLFLTLHEDGCQLRQIMEKRPVSFSCADTCPLAIVHGRGYGGVPAYVVCPWASSRPIDAWLMTLTEAGVMQRCLETIAILQATED